MPSTVCLALAPTICLGAGGVFFNTCQASQIHAERPRHIRLVQVFAVVDPWGRIAYAVMIASGLAQLSLNDARTAAMHGACLRCVSAPATQLYIHPRCTLGALLVCGRSATVHGRIGAAVDGRAAARWRPLHHRYHADGGGGGLAAPPPWVMVVVVSHHHDTRAITTAPAYAFRPPRPCFVFRRRV